MTRTSIAPLAGSSRPPAVSRPAGLLALWAAVSVVSALVLTGCGSEPEPLVLPKEPLHPVAGKILLRDGKPLSEGTVVFTPVKATSRPARGKVEPDGTFHLKTLDEDGAAEGDYHVGVDSTLSLPGPKPGTTKPVVHPMFGEEASPFPATVKAGKNELPPLKLIPPAREVARRTVQD